MTKPKAEALEPASSIIARLGGEKVVRKITGTGEGAAYAWQRSKAFRGTDGLIPARHHPVLLAFAARMGIPLTPYDFLPIPRRASPRVRSQRANVSRET